MVTAQRFPNIEVTFAPTWWHHHYGMDFGAALSWQDPIRSTERDREQRRLLYERFGEIGLGEANPLPNPVTGGEFGHRFMSAFWGCEVVYFADQWPHAVPLPQAGEHMAQLRFPRVESSAAAQLLLRNARILIEQYGSCRAVINYGGPLNNAVSVLGEAIFMACAAQPELAQAVLRQMGQAVLEVNDLLEAPINGIAPSSARKKRWEVGNCPVGQISPAAYRKVVLPVDRWLCQQFEGEFWLHHCGLFHPYAQVYQELSPAALDVGPGSDLRLTRQAYPAAMVSTYIEVGSLIKMDESQIDALVGEMIEDAGGLGLLANLRVAEVGPEISDATVRSLATVRERLQRGN